MAELEERLSDPSLWDDHARAQQLTTRLARLRDDVERYEGLAERLEEAEVLDQLLDEQADPDTERELKEHLESLAADVDRLELAALLSGEFDDADAIASLHAGAGGTESQDWAEMLLRMYLRWAEREGFEVELDEVSPGEEAGIKSATVTVKGKNAYGILSAERGVHR
ncbi:MAG TPA: PCRF domain-containing protein, partial [Actinomycetota bacterium]